MFSCDSVVFKGAGDKAIVLGEGKAGGGMLPTGREASMLVKSRPNDRLEVSGRRGPKESGSLVITDDCDLVANPLRRGKRAMGVGEASMSTALNKLGDGRGGDSFMENDIEELNDSSISWIG